MEFVLLMLVAAVLILLTVILLVDISRKRETNQTMKWTLPASSSLGSVLVIMECFMVQDQLSHLPFDIQFSLFSLSFSLSSLPTTKLKWIFSALLILLQLILFIYYLLTFMGICPMLSSDIFVMFSIFLMMVFSALILYLIWCRIRDVHALMKSASVWSWLTLSVDVFYFMTAMLLLCFYWMFPDSVFLQSIVSLMMVLLTVACVIRHHSQSAFALLQSHERCIVESMKISSVDAVVPGSGEDYLYKELFERVQKYFEEEKPFLNGNLTINDVAAEVFSNKVYISRAISHCTGRNFCQYVNYHRVMYSVECFRAKPSLKVSELWPMCGFNTIVSFNMAFRLFMNENPSDWCRHEKVKMHRNGK